MNTEENNQGASVTPEANGGEDTSTNDTVSLSKTEYEELVGTKQTVGSLKRELKDAKKALEESKGNDKSATPEKNQEISSLQEKLDKLSLRGAGITHEDDIELAKKTAEKWNMSIDDVVEDEDFKVKLERQQTNRANADATSGVKGNKGNGGSAKETSAYWKAKGVPPTPQDVPDRKARAKIINDMRRDTKSGKIFYND